MKRVQKLLRLPSTDRLLLVKAAFWVGAIRLGLWLLPFQSLLRLLASQTRRAAQAQGVDRKAVRRVTWAVRVTSRYVPAATCLTQALATLALLAGVGQPANIRIGIAKGGVGKLHAHAWVEIEGKVIIGKSADLAQYTVLPSIGAETL